MRIAYLAIDPDNIDDATMKLADILHAELSEGILIRAWDEPEVWLLPPSFKPVPHKILKDLQTSPIQLSDDDRGRLICPELSTLYRTSSIETLAYFVQASVHHTELPLTVIPSSAASSDELLRQILHAVDWSGVSAYRLLNIDLEWFLTVNAEVPDDCMVCFVAKENSPLWKGIDANDKADWRDDWPVCY